MDLSSIHPSEGVQRVVKSAAIFQQLGVKKTLEFLESHHITGDKSASTRCVLAEYFKYVSGGEKVSVSDRIQVGDFSFETPQVLRYIWTEFDQGRYPQLERPDDKNAQEIIASLMATIKLEEAKVPIGEITDAR